MSTGEMVKNKKKFKFVSDQPRFVYYAAYTPDGKVWCSGRNVHEIVGLSKDIEGVTYSILEYYEVTNGDQPWTPPKEILEHPRTQEYSHLHDEEDVE